MIDDEISMQPNFLAIPSWMATFAAVVALCATAQAETVYVKYRGSVDLKPFECENTVSSFVNRVCYDKANSYVAVTRS
jgi:hypothetical protein